MNLKKLHQDVWIGIFILVLCAVFFLVNGKLSSDSGMMPRLLLAIMSVLGICIAVTGFQKSKNATPENPVTKMISCESLKVPFSAYLYIVAYVILFKLVGYFVATPVFLLALIRHFKVKSMKVPVLVTVIYLAVIYLFFVKQLNVSVDDLGALGTYISMRR